MQKVINTSLRILLVDDNDIKTQKIRSYLESIISSPKITVVQDQISAQKSLESTKFDLLILDILLPLRICDSEPEMNGGENLLDELSIGEYIQPTQVVAITEFDELQTNIRNNFPELGAIKYDASSLKWMDILYRVLANLSKLKLHEKKIIYCEGENSKLFNLVGLTGVDFWPLKDSRAIYLAAKNEPERFAIRDRDFLTSDEISLLTNKPYFQNYIILNYYCFENYLYHPSNISEVVENFNVVEYVKEITKQKNEKFTSIIQDYKISRLAYADFTDNDKKTMNNEPELEIVACLKSDDFETFYKFFDMAGKKDNGYKKSFDKTYLQSYNINKENLVKTAWFQSQMKYILEKVFKTN